MQLREMTGVGMMECKKALQEVGGDLNAAVEFLRKQGLKASASKAARVAAEGMIAVRLSADAKTAVALEINCETDFVAKNEDFIRFAGDLAGLILESKPASVDALLTIKLGSETVAEKVNLLTAKIGEKIALRRFVRIDAKPGQTFGAYLHLGSKIGVLVALEGAAVEAAVAKEVAMHVAASHPLYLNRTEISQEVLDKEKAISLEQLKDSGKPANVLEKIVEGKLAKYASEICLNDQIFIKDPTGKKSVSQILKDLNPALKVAWFVRYQVGEGIEKRQDDFAAEVAKMVK